MNDEKYKKLQEIVSKYDKAVISFSGGVDSTLVAKITYDILHDNAIAITIDSNMISEDEIEDARNIAKEIGIRHRIVKENFLLYGDVIENSNQRCYFCKRHFVRILKRIAMSENADVIFDGTNADDMKEYRPGLKAIREGDIVSPLAEVGLTKDEIRELSKKLGLSNYAKYSNTCLATRIPYGRIITKEKLKRIEIAERILKNLKVRHIRVRDYDDTAIIEAFKKDFSIIMENSDHITNEFNKLDFTYVTYKNGFKY